MSSEPRDRQQLPVRVSFLVPVFNEAATVVGVLERVAALGLDTQIVVVDDGSTDGSAQLVEEWIRSHDSAAILLRQQNRGKGAAVRAAIPHVDGDIALIQDADLEYDPTDVPDLIEPIVRGAADVVYGSRLTGGRPQRAYLFWHLVGNKFLSLLTSVLFNTTLSDMETGYKAFRADVLRSLDLREDDFAIEPEITGKVCKRRLRIYELPISYYGRTYDEGKKITWRDGFKAIWVRSGEAALDEIGRHPIRLVVLDIGLPGIDGFDVCRSIRARLAVPIVMLTARDEEPDRVAGLEVGADDYVTKPFSLSELIARVKAILRRTQSAAPAHPPTEKFGAVEVNPASRTVTKGGDAVQLTPKEFDLLLALIRRRGAVASRLELLKEVWGHQAEVMTRTVDIHVAELRRKLEDDPAEPRHILSVWKKGYRLRR